MRVQISHGQLGGYHATSWSRMMSVGVLAKLQLHSPILREHFLRIPNHPVALLLVAEHQQRFIPKSTAHQQWLQCSACISYA